MTRNEFYRRYPLTPDQSFRKRHWFWLSIVPVKKCLFSRRNGYVGVRICGYSVCLRLFNVDLL